MAKIARIGDQIQHGTVTGVILSTTLPQKTYVGGQPVAHLGDTVTCSTHGPNTIATASATVKCDGQYVARVGDTTVCGATIKEATVHPNVHAGN